MKIRSESGQVGWAVLAVIALIAGIVILSVVEPRNRGAPGQRGGGASVEPGEARIIVFMLDDTGSFSYFFASTEKIRWAIDHLRLKDRLYVIYIGSYAKESVDLRIKPNPELYAEMANLPPDRMYCPAMAEYKKDYRKQLFALKFKGVRHTDVYGAFYYATIILKEDAPGDKYLVVCSDLGDTVNREELIDKIDLTGVNVCCLYFPTDLIVGEGRATKPNPELWKDRISYWGAQSVEIYNHVQSATINPLKSE